MGTPLAVLGAFLYARMTSNKNTPTVTAAGSKKPGPGGGKKKAGQPLKEIWQVKNISPDGVIELAPGGSYRLVCRLAAQDYHLLSPPEQDAVEDALAAVLRGLSFPVQALTTAETLDTRGAVNALRESAARLPRKVAEHAAARAEYLEALMVDRAVTARTAYLVIPFEDAGNRGPEHAKAELYARLSSLAAALQQAKARLEPLDINGVCDLLAHLLNRGRAFRPSEAGERGIMSSFHISAREALAGDEEEEEE